MGMQNSKYLVAGYPFEGNANDIKGVNNFSANGVTYVSGKIGKAANFDGVDDYLIKTNFSETVKAVSFWIFKAASTNVEVVYLHNSGIAFGFVPALGQIILTTLENANRKICPISNFIYGQWNHIYQEWADDGTPSLWINAVKQTLTVANGFGNSTADLYVGKRATGNHVACRIDLFKTHSKRLTQSEIQRDYLNLPIL